MEWPDRFVADSAPTWLAPLAPADRVAIVSFSGKTRLKQRLTADHRDVERALARAARRFPANISPVRDVAPAPGAPIHDALLLAARQFEDPGRARAILLVYDDIERGSKTEPARVSSAVRAAGAVVTAVLVQRVVPAPGTRTPMPGVPPDIQRWRHPAPSDPKFSAAPEIARETGGEFLTLRQESAFMRAAVESVLRHAK